MRVLTVKQPWAWSIFHAGKTVENRSIAWSYRGLLAIHAGRGWDEVGMDHPGYRAALAAASSRARHRVDTAGAVIGFVQLVDAHEATTERPCCDSPWADPDAGAHLVVADPVELDVPVRATGRLGLWRPDPGLADHLTTASTSVVDGQLAIEDAIAEAERLRDEGMAQTTAAADADDIAVIDQAIAHLNDQGTRWSANDLRELLPEVRQPLIGARVRAHANRRAMRRVDYTPSTLPSTHRHPVAVWVGAEKVGVPA